MTEEPKEKSCAEFGQAMLTEEAEALATLARRLGKEFNQAIKMILDCEGTVILTGLGKSGIIAQKISSTLASTGTLSYFVHPADALHGDLGRVRGGDLIIVLSYGGETDEVINLVEILVKMDTKTIGITAREGSTLARKVDQVLLLGEVRESGPLGLVPTTSSTCMLALGDALAMTVMRARNFSKQDYAVYHPGGALGQRLSRVDDRMNFHMGKNLAVAQEEVTVRKALATVARLGKRSGAILIVDRTGRLSGIFTDADLRRLFESGTEAKLDKPIASVMTRNPRRIRSGTSCWQAARLFEKHRVDELPVVNELEEPVGLLDVQDLVAHKTT